ncbi:MAG: molybdopterin-synthase adenylyltransferase MoeB [Chryseolinea sp.]
MTNLTNEELIRYNRHLILQDFGATGQRMLKNGSVLVVGAGGLGSPSLLYLTAAGVGTIGIIDFDTVDISNLQRQVIFTTEDVGKNKAEAASLRLSERNPHVLLKTYSEKLTSFNALDIIRHYDVVVDGTDNFPTRYLINDACVLLNKAFVYGSILTYEGQISVFNYQTREGNFSANYRDLFPTPPDPSSVQNCEQAGVLGVLPGIIGGMQANEVIKILTGIGEVLANKLLLFDSLTMQQTIVTFRGQHSREHIKYLVDYDEFCGVNPQKSKSLNSNQTAMKEVTVQELKKLKETGTDFQLIDVREPHEYDICNLDGELIPQAEIPSNVDKVSKTKQVVIHCRSGARSGNMVQWLEKNHGFENLYNLKGGILAWAKEIDPTMPTY